MEGPSPMPYLKQDSPKRGQAAQALSCQVWSISKDRVPPPFWVLSSPLSWEGFFSLRPPLLQCMAMAMCTWKNVWQAPTDFSNPLWRYSACDIFPPCLGAFLTHFHIIWLFTSFLSVFMFLQFPADIYLQNSVQGVLLTNTCSDWFQKDGAGLTLQTFLDLIRKSCGEETAAPTFFFFSVSHCF